MKTLGEQAKTFREGKKWNTAQMAAAVETSRQNIESLEAHGNRSRK
jgi:DNA-binding XRE family transcriptional regulator